MFGWLPSSSTTLSCKQHRLPPALQIQDKAHVCEGQDRAGKGNDLSAWQISPKCNANPWMLTPMQAVCFKKTRAFHHLSFIPSPSWFSFTRECQSTIQAPGCKQDFWLLVETAPTFLPLLQFYLVLYMFLYITIGVPNTVFLDFSGSFPLILSFQSCFYKAKHRINTPIE